MYLPGVCIVFMIMIIIVSYYIRYYIAPLFMNQLYVVICIKIRIGVLRSTLMINEGLKADAPV